MELIERLDDRPSQEKRRQLAQLLRQQLLRLDGLPQAPGTPRQLPNIVPSLKERHEPFPLTDIQQAYWVGRSAAYDQGDVSIHMYTEIECHNLDVPRFNRAWQRLVERHDMLRALVLPDGRQHILVEVPSYTVAVYDLRGRPADIAASELMAIREELAHQVLPTDSWPGFDIRATLLDEQRTRLHISIDLLHIDGGSLMILYDELARFYRSPDEPLSPLDLSYRDYALAVGALQESAQYQRSLDYWQQRVATLPPAPQLPTVQPSEALRATRFQHRTARLEPAVWEGFKAQAARRGLTPSVALLTAYAEILAAWSASPDFTLNVTLFNRLPLHEQVNQILGDFTSMVLLQTHTPAAESFTERAKRNQKQLWTDLEHRLVSGVRVLRELARTRGHTTEAMMPIVFTSLLDLNSQGFRSPTVSLRQLGDIAYSITQTPQVWLDHQVLEEEGALVMNWDAVEGIFPANLLDDMFTAYCQFLRRLADDESTWQGSCYTHLSQEQLAQRSSINATDAPVPQETLHTLFMKQAALRPDHPAIITADRTLTYAETMRRATQLGRVLQELGARPDTLVAIVMEKGWEQVVAALGIHAAGAAYLPVDPGLPLERRNYLLEHSEVLFVVTQSWVDQQLEWPTGIRRMCVDNDELTDVDDAPLEPVQQPGNLSHVIYTSGSTGIPKGVMIEHRNVVNRIIDVNQRLGVGPADRVLALTALHHDLSVYDIFGILAAGGTTVIPDAARTRDPAHWATLMVRERVTLWNSVPAFLQMLVEYLEHRADQPELLPYSLRSIVLAGDWIPVSLPDRLRALVDGVQVIASGGPTETTIWDIWYPVENVDPSWQSIPYGKPMANTQYYVLNHALEPCPVWVPGQLYIGGVGLARGYWRDEEKTRERFIAHPQTGERLYRSGDMGRYLPDGNIEFLGREDFQVKIGGYRIELGEIEAALQQHPAISAAVVSAVGEPRGLKRLVAYVVPKCGKEAATLPASTQPNDGKNLDEFKQKQLSGIAVLNAVDRIDFKLQQWGIRRDTGLQTIQFPAEPDELAMRAYSERRSVRNFAPDPLPFRQFGAFLRSLSFIEMDDLPKYRYPSGGGLYPVQTYLYIKPGRIEGIPGGVYYHHPKHHQLLLLSPEAQLDNTSQMPHNRAVFDKAAFVVFFIGQLKSIEPLYGEFARDFCLLEAGYMSQLLMMVAPAHQIGLCPIGAMEFEPVRHFFHLEDSHILVHLMFGGVMGSESHSQEISIVNATHTQESPSQSANSLADEMRAFLKQKLPEQMQPSAYVLLDALPLTSNGKVDRRLLPSPEEASESAQPLDAPPRNDVERTLITIAQEVLHIERIGIHQNFFDLGGSSIHMVQILNKVRATFQQEFSITEIFRHPTISLLAAYLSQEQPALASFQKGRARAEARLASKRKRLRDGETTKRQEGRDE